MKQSGDWRKDLLTHIGAPITAHNLKLLSVWQRWEGGHTNNNAKYNWLNTTIDAPGAVESINSVGVKRFNSYKAGINAIASTLLNGRYGDIVQGLRSGNPYKHDISGGLQIWVSGSPTGNPGYAQKVTGGSAPKATLPRGGGGAKGNLALAPPPPGLSPLMKMAFDDDPEFLSLLESITKPATPSVGKGQTGPQKPQDAISGPGGGWGGSYDIAKSFASIAREYGVNPTSEKRDRKATASGGVSDHWTGSKTSYAFDLSNGSKPTKQMDEAAKAIMRSLGVEYDGKSELVKNVTRNGYRIQVIYRSNVGGNHYNHIHVGVRKL